MVRGGWVSLVLLLSACSAGSSATVSPDAVSSPTSFSNSQVETGSSAGGITAETVSVLLPVVEDDRYVRYRAVLAPALRHEFERQSECLDAGGFGMAAEIYRAIPEFDSTWGYLGSLQFSDPNIDRAQMPDGFPQALLTPGPTESILRAYPQYGIDPGLVETVIEVLSDCPVWTEEEQGVHQMHNALVADLAVFEDMWLRRLDEIDERADVKVVVDGIVPCLHESSPLFAEVTEPGLFLVDDRERPDEEVASMVRMAMECYRPLEEIRRPLREALRDEYVDEHYAELLEWQERIVSVRKAVEALN